jgi:hypothetical protein
MSRERYPAARLAAPGIADHFARHLADASDGDGLVAASVPDVSVVETIIDAAFWASLRREEGYVPTISIAYLPPEQDPHPLLFAERLPLTPTLLAKIAPIVERPGIHLGVWNINGELAVWGTARGIPQYCFVLEVIEPGLLVVKRARGGERSGKYVNVAVLEGDQFKLIDVTAQWAPDCPTFLASLLGVENPSFDRTGNVLVQLAVSMRAHRRGGSLLIVPAGSDQWRNSIVTPMPYAVVPPFRELASLVLDAQRNPVPQVQAALRQTVDAVAGLTAADGATVMTDAFELLAFGAKITPRRGSEIVEHVLVTEPIIGDSGLDLTTSQLGGTRHLSAAQFVSDQRNAVALVASQDRRFTLFSWSSSKGRVHAHRIEALLL